MSKQNPASAASTAKKESIWRDRFARHAASKQSIEAFCRSESVSSALFYHWRKRLGIKATNSPLAPGTPSASFIDLGAVNVPAPKVARQKTTDDAVAHAGIELRIELSGVVLTIVRH
jgi:transposase-like protein